MLPLNEASTGWFVSLGLSQAFASTMKSDEEEGWGKGGGVGGGGGGGGGVEKRNTDDGSGDADGNYYNKGVMESAKLRIIEKSSRV